VLDIPVVEGRTFQSSDRAGAPAVVVVSAASARRLWPNESAIGKRLRLGAPDAPEVTVVGVVGDVRYRDLRTPLLTSEPDVYFPLAQRTPSDLAIGVESDLTPERMLAAVRREIASLDPSIPLARLVPMQQLVDQQTANGRFASSVLMVFGVTALTLTAVGLYGVLAFLVSLRRRELGIRIALGATRQMVMRQVVGYGLKLIGAGIVIGVLAASGVTKWISTQLFGVRAYDPAVFITVPLVLIAIAILASWLPARRAAGVDPQAALRLE
jgi:putative ABC transport system permease protein